MKIYLICPVRLADTETQYKLSEYVKKLESEGHEVYYPRRDTPQDLDDFAVNAANRDGVRWCDEAHIWYMSESQGIHFDMGMAFILDKPLYVVHNVLGIDEYSQSYPEMLYLWEKEYSRVAATN